MIRVYTSATKSYMPKARVLATSVKQIHPEYWFCLLISDSLPADFNIENEPFDEVVTIEELGLPDLKPWIFRHAIVELCTAVKGTGLVRLLQMDDTDAVFYLDPDTWVKSPLSPLQEYFEQHDILLTPHLLHPEDDIQLIHGNEIVTTLAHGIYNLGFIGVKNSEQGMAFAKWWEKRLLNFCYDDVPQGLFTDQRWCDFVPAFFPGAHIIRDLGYNVATWNIRYRPITKSGDQYMAGGEPLRFYHFTGFDSGKNFDDLLKRFAKGYPAAFELWQDYGEALSMYGHDDDSLRHWEYASFSNGKTISKKARRLYRSDPDLQRTYPDPFNCDIADSFYQWCLDNNAHGDEALDFETEMYRLRHELDSVYRSKSWRITSPLRWAVNTLIRK